MMRASNPEPNAWVAGDVGARAKCDEAAAAACHNHVRLHPLKNRFTNPSERLGVAAQEECAARAVQDGDGHAADRTGQPGGAQRERPEPEAVRHRTLLIRPCSASLTHPLQAVYPKLSASGCCGSERRGGVGGGVRSEGQTGGPRAQLELDVGRPAVACCFELSRQDGEKVVYLEYSCKDVHTAPHAPLSMRFVSAADTNVPSSKTSSACTRVPGRLTRVV